MPCSNEVELEKQMVSSLINGDNVRILDNLEDGTMLSSKLLTQSLSERQVQVRILGKSKQVDCPGAALTAATGVNIRVKADLNRRHIDVRFDPRMASPETRLFKRKNIIEMLIRERPAVLRDLFTIVHAYLGSGADVNVGELAGATTTGRAGW